MDGQRLSLKDGDEVRLCVGDVRAAGAKHLGRVDLRVGIDEENALALAGESCGEIDTC